MPRGRVSLLGESLKDKLIIPEAGTGMDGPIFKNLILGLMEGVTEDNNTNNNVKSAKIEVNVFKKSKGITGEVIKIEKLKSVTNTIKSTL